MTEFHNLGGISNKSQSPHHSTLPFQTYGYLPLCYLLKDPAKLENWRKIVQTILHETAKSSQTTLHRKSCFLTSNNTNSRTVNNIHFSTGTLSALNSYHQMKEKMQYPTELWLMNWRKIRQTSDSLHLPPSNSMCSEKWFHLPRND